MLADAFRAAMPELQAEAESAMVTPCRVKRPTGVTPDPVTGADVDTSIPVASGGYCKLQEGQAETRLAETSGGSVTLTRQEVHFPVGRGPFRGGDYVEILDRPDTAAAVVLRTLRIQSVPLKTWRTAQRLPVEEIS